MLDFNQLKKIYKIGKHLEWKNIQNLVSSAQQKTFAPSEYLIQEGSTKREAFFIKKGLIRSFSLTKKGDEITMGLFWENQPMASPDIILFNRPCRYYFQAIEPTETLSLDYDVLQKMISENPKLGESRKLILHKVLKDSFERVESFVLYSPEERYLRFVESKPDIVNRVPNKYIANILGVTPVSLSRIRKRITSKKK